MFIMAKYNIARQNDASILSMTIIYLRVDYRAVKELGPSAVSAALTRMTSLGVSVRLVTT